MNEPEERERVKTILQSIADDREAEARWLNTVSMLEYIGARKIGKTVCKKHPSSAEILDHWADETRHAYAFKRLYEEVAGDEIEGYLVPKAAKKFFAELDRRLSAWMCEVAGEENTFENYLLVTTLIERRAMMLYPLYRSATQRDIVREELKQIIVEEQDHRVAIEENCLELLETHDIDDLREPLAIEGELFNQFLDAVSAELKIDESDAVPA